MGLIHARGQTDHPGIRNAEKINAPNADQLSRIPRERPVRYTFFPTIFSIANKYVRFANLAHQYFGARL